MATIVEYTDRKPPQNRYPTKIVSPARSAPCCYAAMEDIGRPHRAAHWEFRYKRCRTCGFTIRVILRAIPDAVRAEQLRQILAHAFVRNMRDL